MKYSSMKNHYSLGIIIILFICSLSAAVCMMLRISIPGSSLFLKILVFPFHGIVWLSNVVVTHTGILISSPLIFLGGISVSAVFFLLLFYGIPKKIIYIGLALFFFGFFVLVGKNSFIRMFFLLQSTPEAMYESLRTFLEFIIALFLLHKLLQGVTLPEDGILSTIARNVPFFRSHIR